MDGDGKDAGTAMTVAVAVGVGDGAVTRRRSGVKVRWTAAMRATFFAHLACNCNVTAAAAAIGVQPSQVHYQRRISKPFAAEWQRMIDAGYLLLEMRMIGHAMAGGGGTVAGDSAGVEPLAYDEAFKLLNLYRARREGRVRSRGPAQVVATREQADAAILAKLDALAARKARAAGETPA
ncbi:hypothetical protein FHT00_002352 [Sphingomonas insulae]|nr:hypothetical protein [Sphingomonas insulae]NIJ30389.1 hypothetical protein [Sphingomonas insulae]